MSKTRTLAAELALLETYDATRSRLGHDYGGGQRRSELSRRRRELDSRLSLVSRSAPLHDEPTADELREAFERIGRPRLSRLRTEGYRAHTPATTRTRRAWEIVERWATGSRSDA